ncbi:MAG: chloride channel protein [Halioglobus sp.]
MRRLFDKYRSTLGNYQSILSYALLGIIGGLASGLVVLAFELAINQLGMLWKLGENAEGFETLPHWLRFALPVGGAILLGLGFSMIKPEDRETGIVHVISRMHSHYSILPLRNAVVQFLGGAFAIATGQSGGREGPGVHLGGAINSLLGQKLGLPNNSLRVLIACGTAGGIAAAFGTPLAGVIFAMEVIIVEYSVIGFIPVILAAVTASVVGRFLDTGMEVFGHSEVHLNSLWEIPYVLLLGICCGLAVTGFIKISRLSARLSHWPVALRFTLAGLLTGSLAWYVPETLGMGYDTLRLTLLGEVAPIALLTIALCKILATSFSCGVGMPIGLIGPNLLIGACLGGILGFIGHATMPHLASDPALYIVIGMAACMGAVLNAPLAAILAVVELTETIHIAMPALLAVVAATLTNTGVFRQQSAHQTVLQQLKRAVPNDPVNQLLHRTAITSSLEVSVIKLSVSLNRERAELLAMAPPAWCLVERGTEILYLVKGQDLADWLANNPTEEEELDLAQADIRRWTIAALPNQATLRQALDTMHAETVEAVWVYSRGAGGSRVLEGIVTREAVEKFSLSKL